MPKSIKYKNDTFIDSSGITHNRTLLKDILNNLNKEQKILWQGAWYMDSNKTVTLSETISEQKNGIVLVFSGYSNGSPQNYNFTTYFVPKKLLSIVSRGGHFIPLGGTNGITGFRYLYISNDKITGNDVNSRTVTNGITYSNTGYVLRAVIGV